MGILSRYGLLGTLRLLFNIGRTKLVFPSARLIRFPIDVRGRNSIVVGKGFTTGVNCRLEALHTVRGATTIKIGEQVQINDGVHIVGSGSVSIGNFVLIASKVFISDTSHGRYGGLEVHDGPNSAPKDRPLIVKPVTIEDNVWLGDGVVVLPGVTIGYGAIIGANSVVTKCIPAGTIAVGAPAIVIKRFDSQLQRWVSA